MDLTINPPGSLVSMKLGPRKVKEISKAIKEILLIHWDPIGIYHSGPDDEYDSYIWPILKLLRNGTNITEMTDFLYNLEKDTVGSFPENKQQIVLAAEKLVSLKRKFQ